MENLSTSENSNSMVCISKKDEYENDKYRIKQKLFTNQSSPKVKAINKQNSKYVLSTQTTGPETFTSQKPCSKPNTSPVTEKKEHFNEDGITTSIEFWNEPLMCTIPDSVNKVRSSNLNTVTTEKNLNESSSQTEFDNNDKVRKESTIKLMLNSKQEEEFTNTGVDDEGAFDDWESKKHGGAIISRNQRKGIVQDPWTNSNNTIDRIFYWSTQYIISNRLINDEMTQRIVFPEEKEGNVYFPQTAFHAGNGKNTSKWSNNRFNFINYLSNKTNEILENSVIMQKVYHHLLKLPNKTLYHIIWFLFDDLKELTHLNREFTNKINSAISEQILPSYNKCSDKYKNILLPQGMRYTATKTWNKNTLSFCFDCWFSFKIINPQHQSNTIRWAYKFTYVNSKIPYVNYYQFDIVPPSHVTTFFVSDWEGYETCYKRFSNYQQIHSFAVGDSVVIRFNISSSNKFTNLNSIQFEDAYIAPLEQVRLYEKELKINNLYYDKFRSCEIENIIHLWKDYTSLANGETKAYYDKVGKMLGLYNKFFSIDSVVYDKVKYWYFKVKWTAKKVGVVKSNFFIKCNLQVIPKNEAVENDSICWANYNISMRRYQIRIGGSVIWYLVED